eukprot:1123972-Pelagomonas_calceolata.AAC.3
MMTPFCLPFSSLPSSWCPARQPTWAVTMHQLVKDAGHGGHCGQRILLCQRLCSKDGTMGTIRRYSKGKLIAFQSALTGHHMHIISSAMLVNQSPLGSPLCETSPRLYLKNARIFPDEEASQRVTVKEEQTTCEGKYARIWPILTLQFINTMPIISGACRKLARGQSEFHPLTAHLAAA